MRLCLHSWSVCPGSSLQGVGFGTAGHSYTEQVRWRTLNASPSISLLEKALAKLTEDKNIILDKKFLFCPIANMGQSYRFLSDGTHMSSFSLPSYYPVLLPSPKRDFSSSLNRTDLTGLLEKGSKFHPARCGLCLLKPAGCGFSLCKKCYFLGYFFKVRRKSLVARNARAAKRLEAASRRNLHRPRHWIKV